MYQVLEGESFRGNVCMHKFQREKISEGMYVCIKFQREHTHAPSFRGRKFQRECTYVSSFRGNVCMRKFQKEWHTCFNFSLGKIIGERMHASSFRGRPVICAFSDDLIVVHVQCICMDDCSHERFACTVDLEIFAYYKTFV